MKSHRNVSRILQTFLECFKGSPKEIDKKWWYVKQGKGLFKGRPQCLQCGQRVSIIDSPVHLYSLWSCNCGKSVVLPQEAHFRKCPFCYGKKRNRVRCSPCKGRGWMRI